MAVAGRPAQDCAAVLRRHEEELVHRDPPLRRVRLAGGPRDGVGAEPHWEVSPAGSSRHTQWQLREKVPMQTGWFSEGKRPKHAWIRRAPVQQGFAVHPCSRALQSVGRPPHIAPTREKVNENDYWLQWLNIKGA